MISLKDETKKNIQRHTGLSVNQMSEMNPEEIDAHIEAQIGKKLTYDDSSKLPFQSRGSVYLSLSRMLGIDIINKKLAKQR